MQTQEAESKTRMLCSVWNVLDFVAFFPPLLELALMYGANLPFRLGRFDLRWFKILRWVNPPLFYAACMHPVNLSFCSCSTSAY